MMLDATIEPTGVKISFADGLKGTVPWRHLNEHHVQDIEGIEFQNPYVLNLLYRDGHFEEIPWTMPRRSLDRQFRTEEERSELASRRTLGERIRSRRQQALLSQRTLAERAHVPLSTLARMERGEAKVRFSVLEALARALGGPVTYLTLPPEALGPSGTSANG